MNTLQKRGRGLIFLGLFLAAGCSGSDQPTLSTVTGTVTLDGKPLQFVEVSFDPSEGRPSYGTTDSSGKYELTYIRDTKGAKLGTHKVTVRSPKVDNSKLQPVEVVSGSNVIDLKCEASTGPAPSSAEDE